MVVGWVGTKLNLGHHTCYASILPLSYSPSTQGLLLVSIIAYPLILTSFTNPFIHPFTYLSVYQLSIYSPTHSLSLHLSTCASIQISTQLPIYPPINPSIYPSTHHPTICLSTHSPPSFLCHEGLGNKTFMLPLLIYISAENTSRILCADKTDHADCSLSLGDPKSNSACKLSQETIRQISFASKWAGCPPRTVCFWDFAMGYS